MVWDVSKGELVTTYKGATDGPAHSAWLDSQSVLTVDNHLNIHKWDARTGSVLDIEVFPTQVLGENALGRFCLSEDGHLLLLSVQKQSVLLWDRWYRRSIHLQYSLSLSQASMRYR